MAPNKLVMGILTYLDFDQHIKCEGFEFECSVISLKECYSTDATEEAVLLH